MILTKCLPRFRRISADIWIVEKRKPTNKVLFQTEGKQNNINIIIFKKIYHVYSKTQIPSRKNLTPKESRSLCLGNYMLTYSETTINKNKLLIVIKLQPYQDK